MRKLSKTDIRVMDRYWEFLKRERAASMVEYALVVALIGFCAAIGAAIVGGGLTTMFGGVGGELNTANIPGIP